MRNLPQHAIVNLFEHDTSRFPLISHISDITISPDNNKNGETHTLKIQPATHTLSKKSFTRTVPATMTAVEVEAAIDDINQHIEMTMSKKRHKVDHVIKLFDVPSCYDFVQNIEQVISQGGQPSTPFITRQLSQNANACAHIGQMFTARGQDALSTHSLNDVDTINISFVAGDMLLIQVSYYVQAGDLYRTYTHSIKMGTPERWFAKIVLDEHHIDDTFSAMEAHCRKTLDRIGSVMDDVLSLGDLPYYIQSQAAFDKELVDNETYSIRNFSNRISRIKSTLATMEALYEEGQALRHQFGEDWLLNQYTQSRKGKRKVIIYAGPTNSGKTYHSIGHIKTTGQHAYFAPLRLLAMEVADTLNNDGVPCSLITGEERTHQPGATVTASTIEMANLNISYDSVIIDEAQMITDESRGSAWTRAILGVNARTLVLCCSPNAVAPLEKLLHLAGDDDIDVVPLTRMTTLSAEKKACDFDDITPGTAVIAFSKSAVLNTKIALEKKGLKVSAIYGALPPEVRRSQADDFANGVTDVVIATDAIGMGMNLPIERVIFINHEKYNGKDTVILDEGLVKQIAGRAGRYGKYEKGFYGAISPSTLSFVRNQVLTEPTTLPTDFFLSPSPETVLSLATSINDQAFDKIINHFIRFAMSDPRFKADKWECPLAIYHATKASLSTLPLKNQIPFLMAPGNTDNPAHVELILDGCIALLNGERVEVPETPRLNLMTLSQLESTVTVFNLYRYLHYQFPETYPSLDFVNAKMIEINTHIEQKLTHNSGNFDFFSAGFGKRKVG